ncbi:MAG TPA: hypothetical protein VM095_15940 [Pyrinomonadaceae bacterium]|nr:hypothetical protein [Pyrinomonadaceae bacterium]
MNQKLLVSLESPQHGFMSLRLKAGEESFVAVVSHTPYDSLRDLVVALSALLDNDCEVTVKWNSEPEEYDFQLAARGDVAQLLVIHYPDHRRAAETGNRVFSFEDSKAGVCVPFWTELRGLRARTIQDEFDRQWRREFPESELNELTKRIKSLGSDV